MSPGFSALRLGSVVLFVCLNALDAATTFLGIRMGFSEGNALPSAVLSTLGEEAMYALKLLVVWMVVALVIKMSARYWRLWYALHSVNAILIIVVMANLSAVLSI